MEPGDRIGAGLPVHLRQVPDRPSGPDELLVGLQLRHFVLVELALHIPARLVDLGLARRVGLEEPVAQPKRAQREAPGVDEGAITEPGQLHAATSHVHDHAVLGLDPVDRPEEGVPSLLLPVDDPDGQPALHQDPLQQLVGVLGFADRRGGHGDGLARSRAHGDGLEVPECIDRALDRFGAQAPAVAHVSGQPEGRTRVGQDLQVSRGIDPKDDHAARVRAEVDDREWLLGHVKRLSAGEPSPGRSIGAGRRRRDQSMGTKRHAGRMAPTLLLPVSVNHAAPDGPTAMPFG